MATINPEKSGGKKLRVKRKLAVDEPKSSDSKTEDQVDSFGTESQGYCGDADYSDAAFGLECEKERILKHQRQLTLWKIGTLFIVLFIGFCVTCGICNDFASIVKKAKHTSSMKIESVSADLGIERPNFLPITDFEIKRAEDKIRKAEEAKRQKFIDEHDGNVTCIFICKCPRQHVRRKCRYCGKRRNSQKKLASHRGY